MAATKNAPVTLPEYNGWTNKPTWSVNLWLTNDPYTESELRAICNRGTVYEATQALQYFVEDMVLGNEAGSLGGDLIGWALAYVEWREIVENNREEEEDQGVCTYCGKKYGDEDADDGYCDECRDEANRA